MRKFRSCIKFVQYKCNIGVVLWVVLGLNISSVASSQFIVCPLELVSHKNV